VLHVGYSSAWHIMPAGEAQRLWRVAPCVVPSSRDSIPISVARKTLNSTDLNFADQTTRLFPDQVHTQQAIAEIGGFHLDAVGQHEGAAELSGCYPAMNVFARLVVLLPTSDRQLVVFQDDLELIALEACHCKGNAQLLDRFR